MANEIKPEQVPPEVVNAFKASSGTFYQRIAAALNAWPGMGKFEDETGWDVHIELPLLVPLTPPAGETNE